MILLVTKIGIHANLDPKHRDRIAFLNLKLAGVKFLKMLTDLSLKECKDLLESVPFSVLIKDDKNLFNEHIKYCDFEWQLLDDTESKRQDKFIEMGMSESDAVIERLLLFHLALNGSDLEHLKELYGYLSRDQLVEIFNKRKKQIQERFHNV